MSIGVEDGKLKAVVQFMPASVPIFGPKAEGIYQMCLGGYLNATSVGFKPVEWSISRDPERKGDDMEPGADFERAELVEFSIVSVPCNPEALIEAVPAPQPQQEPQQSKAHGPLNSTTKFSRTRLAMQIYALTL